MQSIKQAWQLMRENPLVSVISILGTALSIAMILVVVLTFQISNSGYPPESNRGRMLYVLNNVSAKSDKNSHSGQMSYEVVNECFYTLQTPEAVTAITDEYLPISLPAKRLFKEYSVKYTDYDFWRVFDFVFLQGKPFSKADFQSGIPNAVVTSNVASKLFGTEESLGKTIIINDISYTIVGIVKPVSEKAQEAYADVWAPYTSYPAMIKSSSYLDGIPGNFKTILLAHKSSDFKGIKEELEQKRVKYNKGKRDAKIDFWNNPISRLEITTGSDGYQKVSMKLYFLRTGFLLLFLLLVPALNLIGFILSSVEKRKEEVGIRKAFGAGSATIFRQILYENLLTTFIGGIVGLALSFLLLKLSSKFLLTAGMIIRPGLFVAALFFVLLLNLISAGIPAMHIARQQIVNALNKNEK